MAKLPKRLKAQVQVRVKYPRISTVRHHIAIYIITFGGWLLGLPFNIRLKIVEVK